MLLQVTCLLRPQRVLGNDSSLCRPLAVAGALKSALMDSEPRAEENVKFLIAAADRSICSAR